jgi:hypothetical protein
MQTLLVRSIAVAAALTFSTPAMPQAAQPRTTGQSSTAASRFDAYDLSDVWQLAPGIWPFEIIHIPGRILMFFEGQHTIREIWMDGRNLPSDPVPAWYGYSVGKWDGDTLIVETIGFNDKTWLGAQGQPHSDQMRTIERYRRVDPATIQFNLTIVDPKIYTKYVDALPRAQSG